MKLSVIKSFSMPVKLRIPTGSTHYETTLTPEFLVMSAEQGDALQKEIEAKYPGTDAESRKAATAEFLDRTLLSLGGIENEDGTPMDKKDATKAVRAYPFIVNALVDGFGEKLQSIRVKN